jgi:hypothetical protein
LWKPEDNTVIATPTVVIIHWIDRHSDTSVAHSVCSGRHLV